MKTKKKPTSVYVCSSLRPRVVKRVDALLKRLRRIHGAPIQYFRPRGTDPSLMLETVREDVTAIEACDELWVVGDYGRDCSWEIGYAMALGKRVHVWLDRTNKAKIQSDWMLRIGFDRNLLSVSAL